MTEEEFHEAPDEALAERLEQISDEEAEQRATALEAGLEGYELEDDDRALLDRSLDRCAAVAVDERQRV